MLQTAPAGGGLLCFKWHQQEDACCDCASHGANYGAKTKVGSSAPPALVGRGRTGQSSQAQAARAPTYWLIVVTTRCGGLLEARLMLRATAMTPSSRKNHALSAESGVDSSA